MTMNYLDEILLGINSADQIKQGEEDEIRAQVDILDAVTSEFSEAAQETAAATANLSSAEQTRIQREADAKKAKLDAGQQEHDNYTSSIQNLNSSIQQNSENLGNFAAENERMNLLSRGIDPETMQPLEGTAKILNVLKAPGRMLKREYLDQRSIQELQEMQMSQMALARQYQNLESAAQYDPRYIEAERQLVDATAFAQIQEVQASEARDLYTLAREKYGMEANQLNAIVSAANAYDEAERPRMLASLMGLKLQQDSMNAALAQTEEEQTVRDAYTSVLSSAAETAGINLSEDTLKVAADRWYRNDIEGLAQLTSQNPELAGLLANANESGMDQILAKLGPDAAAAFARSEDEATREAGEVYMQMYNQVKNSAMEDEDFNTEINEQLAEEGIVDLQSEEGQKRRQEIIQETLQQRTQQHMNAAQQNPMQFLLDNQQVQFGLKVAVDNSWRRQASDPGGEEVNAEVRSASTSLAANMDARQDDFMENPGNTLSSLLKDSVRQAAGKDKTQGVTIQDYQTHAETVAQAAAKVFEQMRDMNQMQFRTDPLFRNSDFSEFTAGFDWTTGPILRRQNFSGRDLTDPNTFLYFLRNQVPDTPSPSQYNVSRGRQ